MAKPNLVRPNLGNPLILPPEKLKRFQITIAGKEDNIPSTTAVQNQLRQNPPEITWKNKKFTLTVHQVHRVYKHPKFKHNYPDGEFADSSAKNQYDRGYRWERRVSVGLDASHIEQLKQSFGWPTLLNLRFNRRSNYHALYVHETLSNSNEFTILHITDTHIAQRNDLIPELLCQTRNKKECEDLKKRHINFNDNLRAFITLANKRMRSGENVIVVFTGDIIDHYFDGYWDGKFICGQGQGKFAKDRRKQATGSAWGYSNINKFRQIILGTDKKGEELLCPLFTVLGNHDYLMNEVLLCVQFQLDLLVHKIQYDKNSHESFGLDKKGREGREYDYWAFPRNSGKHRSLAE